MGGHSGEGSGRGVEGLEGKAPSRSTWGWQRPSVAISYRPSVLSPLQLRGGKSHQVLVHEAA